jgi:hypothetical protein
VDKGGFLSCATSARSIAQSVRHQDRGRDAQASRATEIAELKSRNQLKSSSRCLGPLESQWHRVADANGRVLEEARATSSRKLVVASCSWWPQRRPLIDLNSSRHRALTWMTAYFTLIRTGTAGTAQTAQLASSLSTTKPRWPRLTIRQHTYIRFNWLPPARVRRQEAAEQSSPTSGRSLQ